jgi:hypothetical protein
MTAAVTQKTTVNACSVGTAVPAITWAARIDAGIEEPNAPPTVRMMVLIAVAAPVWACGTASTIRLASDPKAKPMPTPWTTTPATTSACVACATASMM